MEPLITLTVVLELAGAVGLLHARTAPWAGAGLTGLLLAMFPANVYAALEGLSSDAADQLVPRTLMQVVFVAAAAHVPTQHVRARAGPGPGPGPGPGQTGCRNTPGSEEGLDMPLVRIDLIDGRSAAELRAIADGVHTALVDTMNVPAADRFQIVSEHRAELFHYDRAYLESDRSDAVVVVHVTLASGRSTDAKQRFYRRLSDLLAEAVGLRREDLVVALTENGREDWSFGDGAASYLVIPPERWR